MNSVSDQEWMQQALDLARDGLGQTWPNPSVGALVIKDNQIIGKARTAKGGRPHAETIALAEAGTATKGASLYVSLEPCSHQGKTPPCMEAIIQAGISRVVVACTDSNPEVNGAGIAGLKAAGIEVITGVCEEEAKKLNEGFFTRIEKNRPLVALKLATSLDGKIATAGGESQWITGTAAREETHRLRASHDAVLVGIGTVIADNPMLNCRLPELEDHQPVRVVLDSRLRMPQDCKLVASAREFPCCIITTHDAKDARPERVKALEKAGVHVFTVGSEESTRSFTHHIATSAGASQFATQGVEERTHLAEALHCLSAYGITRLLVEAGGTLTTTFLHQGLADRLYWFRAPIIIGEEGMPAFQNGFSPKLDELRHAKREEVRDMGRDILEVYHF